MFITDKIKKGLDDYLEFDSNLIFKEGDPLIFGGSLRDIIAGKEIHDVDIIVGPYSCKPLINLLEFLGWTNFEGLYPKDIANLYTDIKIISEPVTFIKDKKIIQLIRPVYFTGLDKHKRKPHPTEEYKEVVFDLVSNVDLSPCGIAWDSNFLYECFPNAIVHAQLGVYYENKFAKMRTESRIMNRKVKLENRGWQPIHDLVDLRDLKIQIITTDIYLDPKIKKIQNVNNTIQEVKRGKVWN
jgi:hypothetical protein